MVTKNTSPSQTTPTNVLLDATIDSLKKRNLVFGHERDQHNCSEHPHISFTKDSYTTFLKKYNFFEKIPKFEQAVTYESYIQYIYPYLVNNKKKFLTDTLPDLVVRLQTSKKDPFVENEKYYFFYMLPLNTAFFWGCITQRIPPCDALDIAAIFPVFCGSQIIVIYLDNQHNNPYDAVLSSHINGIPLDIWDPFYLFDKYQLKQNAPIKVNLSAVLVHVNKILPQIDKATIAPSEQPACYTITTTLQNRKVVKMPFGDDLIQYIMYIPLEKKLKCYLPVYIPRILDDQIRLSHRVVLEGVFWFTGSCDSPRNY